MGQKGFRYDRSKDTKNLKEEERLIEAKVIKVFQKDQRSDLQPVREASVSSETTPIHKNKRGS